MTESLDVTEAYSAARSTHPRVSLADIQANIVQEHFFTAAEAVSALGQPSSAPLEMLTICILVTRNDFVIIGKSAPASPENFDVEKGKTFAYEDAVRQLWPLMGYALKERLAGQ